MRDQGPTVSGGVKLKRVLGLPLLVLYGLGVTIGAGIYVLVGEAAGRAGVHAPVSFLIAAFIMSFSAGSFAEFSARLPLSAGEAAYVRAGFGSEKLALIVGLVVIVEATIAGATIGLGSVGYISSFVAGVPAWLLIGGVFLAVGAIAAIGTAESVWFAAVLTVIELGGLAAIIGGGFASDPQLLHKLPTVFPPGYSWEAWSGVMAAGLLAFFAFIGFEDMVNVAEETKDPERTLPLAIFICLGVVTLLYFLVTAIAVLSVPVDALARSEAPLGLVFGAVTPLPPAVINLIAIVATLNGVIVQIILASRVIYGLSRQGALPKALGAVNARTRTPLVATALITLVIVVLALNFQLDALAELTSRATLTIFAVVNLALVRLKLREGNKAPSGFSVPLVVPVLGFAISAAAVVFMA